MALQRALDRLLEQPARAAEAVARWRQANVLRSPDSDGCTISLPTAALAGRMPRLLASDLPNEDRDLVEAAVHRCHAGWYATSDARVQTEALVAHLERLALALKLPQVGMRQVGVGTRPDRFGNRTVYPPASRIVAQLDCAAGAMANAARIGPAAVAVTAFLAVLTTHPWVDGNGRVARVLWHGLVGFPPALYLPLHGVQRRSAGSYLIALRTATFDHAWASLIDYLRCVTDYFANDATTGSSADAPAARAPHAAAAPGRG